MAHQTHSPLHQPQPVGMAIPVPVDPYQSSTPTSSSLLPHPSSSIAPWAALTPTRGSPHAFHHPSQPNISPMLKSVEMKLSQTNILDACSHSPGPLTAPLASSSLSAQMHASSQQIAHTLSPLELLELHGRRLAARFDEPVRSGQSDRPLSRLAYREIASELGKPQDQQDNGLGGDLIRAVSPAPISPRSPEPIYNLERPVSYYPQIGSIEDDESFVSEDAFSIPRAASPEEMAPDESKTSPVANAPKSGDGLLTVGSGSSATGLPASLRTGIDSERLRQQSISSVGSAGSSSNGPLKVPVSPAVISRRPSPTPLSRTITPVPDSPQSVASRRTPNFCRPRGMIPNSAIFGTQPSSSTLPLRQLSTDSHGSHASMDRAPSRQDTGDQPTTPLTSEAAQPMIVSPNNIHNLHLGKLGPNSGSSTSPKSASPSEDGERSAGSTFVYSSYKIQQGKDSKTDTKPPLSPAEIMDQEFNWEPPRTSLIGASLGLDDPKQPHQFTSTAEVSTKTTPPTSPQDKSRPGTATRKLQKRQTSRPPQINTKIASRDNSKPPATADPRLLQPVGQVSRQIHSASGPGMSPPTPPRQGRPETSAARPSTSADRTGRSRVIDTDPAVVEDNLEKGITSHENGNIAKATYYWKLAAHGGHPTGMLLYAMACRHGWGMRPNPSEAIKWLQQAVESTQLDASADDGKNGDKPGMKAHQAQFALSVYELGVSYMNGWGVKQDRRLALRCYEIAGSWGDGDALCEAARCYNEGIGVRKRDPYKSAKLYRLAEERGITVPGNSWIHKEKYMTDPASASSKEGTGVKRWFRMGEAN